MQATPPNMPAQAAQLMAAKGYEWIYNGAWQFATEDSRSSWNTSWKNIMPRVGVNYRLGDDAVIRFAYARFMMPISNVRDTLGDFVNQYAGYAQTTNTLNLANGRPQQVLADPFPANNPVQQPTGQSLGRYTGLGGAVSYDEYQLRPQINDRYHVSFQKDLWKGIVFDIAYFYNQGSRVPYTLNLNMRDPSYTYEYGALLNTQVTNPFRNYLTPAQFPGPLRNNATVALGSLLVPYPQYGAISQTNTGVGRNMKTHSIDLKVQRPFRSGISFLAAYAFQRDRIENWLGDDRAVPGAAERRRVGLGVAADQPLASRAPDDRGGDLADPDRPRQGVSRGHAGGARLHHRRLAVHVGASCLLRTSGPVRERAGRQRQPEARFADPRSLVRHQHVRGPAGVHAAHQPRVL